MKKITIMILAALIAFFASASVFTIAGNGHITGEVLSLGTTDNDAIVNVYHSSGTGILSTYDSSHTVQKDAPIYGALDEQHYGTLGGSSSYGAVYGTSDGSYASQFRNTASSGTVYGVASGAGDAYGVYGLAAGSGTNSIGVRGSATTGGTTRIGVYGEAQSGTYTVPGYFYGDGGARTIITNSNLCVGTTACNAGSNNMVIAGSLSVGHNGAASGAMDVRSGAGRIWDGSASVNYATGAGDLFVEDVLEVDNDVSLADTLFVTGDVSQAVSLNGPVKGWAEINSDGTIANGWNVNTNTAQTRLVSTGQYEVDFLVGAINTRPRICMINNAGGGTPLAGTCVTTDSYGDTSSVTVFIRDVSNNLAARSFVVVVY